MSRKLQSQIQSIKKMPGKHKRVLLAFAARANNDGTNIYAAKETMADDAGVSRWTIYRNMDDLIDVGVLVEATSHECGNPNCSKGPRHYPGNGHWTQAYNINVAMLQDATRLVDSLRSKMPKPQRSKMLTSHVAKCDATQSLDSAPLIQNPDSSALTSGLLASSLVSSDDSLRSSSTLMSPPSLRSENENPEPPAAFTVNGKLYEVVDGKAQLVDDEQTAEDKAEIDAYFQIVDENNIAKLLGVPCFHEEHNDALKRMAKVLVHRNRSSRWLYFMVKWMKEHKVFWAKRLHAGDRAIDQLAKHMESGACCDQFDAHLALKDPDLLTPSKYGNELLFCDPLKAQPKHDPWLEPSVPSGWVLENGTLLRPVGPRAFDVEEA